jgi:sigma-B regulation protein RsbU (phosphoserine phosphatase)
MLSYQELQLKLRENDLWPTTRLARIAWYILACDFLLFAVEKLFSLFRPAWALALSGWGTFLSFLAFCLFTVLAYRWLKAKMLWRLRNRLIVTYVFIGVIPVVLLVTLAVGAFYLFAGQFASFVVTSEIDAQLRSVQAANSAIANELAARIEHGEIPNARSLEGLRKREASWIHRRVCAWYAGKSLPVCAGPGETIPFQLPGFVNGPFDEIARDDSKLFLRAAHIIPINSQNLVVISSDDLDQELVKRIANDLGEITLYAAGFESKTANPEQPQANGVQLNASTPDKSKQHTVTLNATDESLHPTFTVGKLPQPDNLFDREITFGTPLTVVDWQSGERNRAGALVRVLTRPSILYERLFAALGDFAKGVVYILLAVAIFFGIIELLALIIGARLTRTITLAINRLYIATKHINRGDFSHRIPVDTKDQLAELANSFNSMTTSLEKLILEQKEKQRLENELVIAQEVQAQLFPKEISQLESLEVHGYCRPARTVSGDYYDFLTINPEKLILAVGDISGKGISAALLMATIHSAVRAYSLDELPALQESLAVGGNGGARRTLASGSGKSEISPGTLLSLLNHQLYDSTPPEKYATLFLGVYEAQSRTVRYSNGGHLPPIIVAEDGAVRRLERGGTVVGLFDNLFFEEGSVHLRPGEIFIAYSDGVTEPENDFGEFGEGRLIDLVRVNRHLPLVRITELVSAAVDDWIGPGEQPDDVTLVLARPR